MIGRVTGGSLYVIPAMDASKITPEAQRSGGASPSYHGPNFP